MHKRLMEGRLDGVHGASRIAEHRLAGRNVLDHDRPRANGAPFTDLKALANGGIQADVATFSQANPAADVRAGCDRGEAPHDAIVADRRVQVHRCVFFDQCVVRDCNSGVD